LAVFKVLDVPESSKNLTPGVEVVISDKELAKWSAPWTNNLVVKVLGKRVSF